MLNLTTHIVNVVILVSVQYQQRDLIPILQMVNERANRLYGDRLSFEVMTLVRPDLSSCLAVSANTADFVSGLYYHKNFSDSVFVAISSGCVPTLMEIVQLATGWNIPLLTINGNGQELRNKETYPTVICMSPSDGVVGSLLALKILQEFYWTNVLFLCDINDSINDIFYIRLCKEMSSILRRKSGINFRLHEVHFHSGQVEDSYSSTLDSVKLRTRVVFILAHATVTRRIMIAAYSKNMTSGDFVYFFTQPFVMPPLFPELTWKADQSDDMVARDAFRAVLYVLADVEGYAKNTRTCMLEGGGLEDPVTRLRTSALSILIYGMIDLFAKVVYNLLPNKRCARSALRGTDIVKEYTNRTFGSCWGKVSFDSDNFVLPNYLLKQFNFTSGVFENVVSYNARDQTLTRSFGRNLSWTNGAPPENEPPCGFDGTGLRCRQYSASIPISAGISVAVLLAGVLVTVTVLYWRSSPNDIEFVLILNSDLIVKKPILYAAM